jgi:hypothetical protein
MIDANFVEALSRSIDRLNVGESASDCLLRYPQYAAELAPLLEVGQVVRRAQVPADEAVRAGERQRARFERALNQPWSSPRVYSMRSLGRLVASVFLMLALLGSGAGLLAESSLPGDMLYIVKLWTEAVRVTLTNYDPDLQAAFAARRIEEARQLVQLHRSAEMTVTGRVQAVVNDDLRIEGLLITVENAQIAPGSFVEVDIRSTDQGQLIALQIRLLDEPSAPPLTPEATPTPRSTQRAVSTSAHSAAPLLPATSSLTGEPTVAQSRADEPTPLEGLPDGRANCSEPPPRWVRHVIQPGDTLSALAVASGGSMDEIVAANCLEDVRSIIAGQIILLPRTVVQTITPPTATSAPVEPVVPPTLVDRPEPTRQTDR